jgi:hypothetical protein
MGAVNLSIPIPTEGWHHLALDSAMDDPVLGALAEHYAAAGCQLAAVAWDPDGAQQPHAVLQVSLTPWQPSGADPLAALAGELAADRPGDVGPRTVSRVDLPAGPAVRVRVIADGGADAARRQVVSDVVQYWLPLPERGLAVVAATSTAILTDGDALADLLDALVPSLTVTD